MNKATKLFLEFVESEQAAGVLLLICSLISVVITNSALGDNYSAFWHTKIGFELGAINLKLSIEHWINDALMAIFFLMIGLEIERELYVGELSEPKNALLPVFAAVGGMAVPALLYSAFNLGSGSLAGIGIPMATDIAFALGILALLGDRVPISIKIFLTALAITDDLGAIVIIAIVYVGDFSFLYLIASLGIFVGLLLLNRLGVNRLSIYLIAGAFMWYFMLKSGIHATLTGVLLAFAIPFRSGDEESPSYRLQHFLHKPVALLIIPLFALANAGVKLSSNQLAGLATANSLGIFVGLLFGKVIGIFAFSFLAVKMGVSTLPRDISWKHLIGAGFLGGIGFTMSIFITLLAFKEPEIMQSSKIAVFISSILAGTVGYLILRRESALGSREPVLSKKNTEAGDVPTQGLM